jgi:hypothetical protein
MEFDHCSAGTLPLEPHHQPPKSELLITWKNVVNDFYVVTLFDSRVGDAAW